MTDPNIQHSKSQLFAEVSKLLNSTLHLDELLDVILNLASQTMEAEASTILVRYDSRSKIELYISSAGGTIREKLQVMKGEGIVGWVAENGQAVISNQVKQDPRYSPELEKQLGFSIQSLICVPLFRKGNLIGAVSALNKLEGKEFNPQDLEVFSSLADQISVALDNSYLYRKAKQKTLEMETLLEVEKSLSSSLNLNELLEMILDSLLKVVKYDAAAIFLVDQTRQEIEHIKARGFAPALEPDLKLKIGHGLAGWAAKMQKSAIVPDVKQDSRYIEARIETQSEMVVPLLSQNRIIGVFNLENNKLNAYGEEDLELLEAFASLAAISIERARQHEEILGKRKLEEELSIAKRIQQSFLPREDPELFGFDICGINIPSEEVGGDYYDFIPIIDNQMGVAIGDVSGKGIPAALIMAFFRASLIAEIRNNYAIRSIMFKVNNLLFESTEPDIYVTAVYGVLDIKNKIFTFANAGHNPPLLRHANGKMENLTQGGMALGAFENSKYEERPIKLNPGDIIVLYTDGVTETKNAQDEEFGTQRLKQVINDSSSMKAKEIRESIHDAVKDFTSSSSQEDDLTLVVIKVEKPVNDVK
jgi:sigma-B regulation protein RsbU (phosphoserine phosphatase)